MRETSSVQTERGENTKTFDVLWRELKAENKSGQFEYDDSEQSFCQIVRRELKNETRHGVYVLRDQGGELIYVGKGGTVENTAANEAQYKSQNIKGRLTAIRGKQTADVWFADVVEQYDGPIIIEYVFLPVHLKQCAAYVEACLLQAYLREKGRLPAKNKAF